MLKTGGKLVKLQKQDIDQVIFGFFHLKIGQILEVSIEFSAEKFKKHYFTYGTRMAMTRNAILILNCSNNPLTNVKQNESFTICF